MSNPADELTAESERLGLYDDPMPLRGGICPQHGEFNNFSGRCLACDRQQTTT